MEILQEVCPRCGQLIAFREPETLPASVFTSKRRYQTLLGLCPAPLCFGVVEVGSGREVTVPDMGLFPRPGIRQYAMPVLAWVTVDDDGNLYGFKDKGLDSLEAAMQARAVANELADDGLDYPWRQAARRRR